MGYFDTILTGALAEPFPFNSDLGNLRAPKPIVNGEDWRGLLQSDHGAHLHHRREERC